MSVVLLYPGEVVGPFDLNEMLKEIHNDERVAVINELARRKANGAPDDGIKDPGPFVAREDLAGLKVTAKTISAKRLRILDARHIAALERYRDAVKANAGVVLTVGEAPVSHEEMATFGTRIDDAGERAGRLAELGNAIYEAKAAYVAAIITELDGFAGLDADGSRVIAGVNGLSNDVIEAFDNAHLILPLFDVAIYLQRLPAKKALRSGPSAA